MSNSSSQFLECDGDQTDAAPQSQAKFNPRPDCGVSMSGLAMRFINDMWMSRPSILLTVVLWPFAVFCMVMAQIKRVLLAGSVCSNISQFVGTCPRVMNPILALSACEISRRIKLHKDDPDKLTSAGVIELYINQIRLTNIYLLAIVATRFEEARREAAAADSALENGTAPNVPFFGVPVVIKECFEMPGMPYTGGVFGRRSMIGTRTAVAIQQLQEAGAIVIASTNISEACMWHESVNTVYGTTNNPYDFGRTAGGSSGGVGAAVSACMAPFGVSSDVGGSTRIPALYNGLFGHKPTGGAVSNSNTYPSCGTGAIQRYCQLGPTCRHSEDLWPLLNAILQRSLLENSNPIQATCPEEVDISSIVVYDLCSNLGNAFFLSTLHPDQLKAQKTAVQTLRKAGAEILKLDMPALTKGLNAFSVWSALMDRESPRPFDEIIREGLGSMFHPWELLKSFADLSVHTPPAVLLAISQRVVSCFPSHSRELCLQGEEMKARLHSLLKSKPNKDGKLQHSVIVMPSLSCTAPMHMENLLRIFDTANTSFFNVMELPVTAVPMGLSAASGLPTGIQVIAGHGNDYVSIGIAQKLESLGVAGWCPPNPQVHSPFY